MTNQVFETGPHLRAPSQGRQNTAERLSRFHELRSLSAHRVTDPRLIRNVRRATGVAKRCFDFAVAALMLALLSPVLLTIAALIKIRDPGPILFGHRRVGRQGGSFYCLKFRTMKMNAEEELRRILATDSDAAAEWNETQKLRNDPRVTKLGAFLRKFSIDELPQLINVLRGEMSLVGPRPITSEELERYGRQRRYYLLVRPGITGLWQVSGRSSATYEQRVQLDREYLEEWSWLGEVWILAMTLPAVFKTEDAC